MRRKLKVTMALTLSLAMIFTATGCGKKSDKKPAPTEEETILDKVGTDLNMDGYNLVWSDDFDGKKLNTDDWNYEIHEPGWVNNELQEYVESDDNIYLKDGKLVIKPIKITNDDGSVSYTSGRVNTQGKKDFTYGVFEAKIKMPKGQGFLPAFWLMATDENVYGQWPRCGEIDITEVIGHDTKKAYSTVHYGNPHNESQGTYTLEKGDFSEEFHTFAVEWLPGKLNWYVDGNLIHTESDWYSKTVGVGEVTYPAPFDQPFYIILNLAVGGNWPGNPDDTTDFEKADMQIDYVKVYQKDSYDENVKKPEKPVANFREPDETGNYLINGDFSVAEELNDLKDWNIYIDKGGKGSASIENNTLIIKSEAAGSEEYSVQMLQPDIPQLKTGKYKLTFDAWADEARTMKTAVTAPNAGWIRYLNDTLTELTTEKQTFTFEWEVTAEDDPTGRLEFNMGKTDSIATIYIQNVRLEMTEGPGAAGAGKNTVLADGNYVYNSRFQEGEAHLGSWDIVNKNNSTVEVTPLKDSRRLHIVSNGNADDVVVSQKELDLVKGTAYRFSFDAEVKDATSIKVLLGGKEVKFDLKDSGSYNATFTIEDDTTEGVKDLKFFLGDTKEIFLDNVRIVEDVMIKNGSFNAGFTGYEVYIDSSAEASYVVDSLTEDNAADFTINNTGDADWKIQLKQNNVELKKGQKYRLTVSAKASEERSLRILMQGGEAKGWAVYSGENTVKLSTDFQTFSHEFEMEADSDPEAFLSICLGAVGGTQIDHQHRVVIDNISLEEI